jgi:hypothetical protein
MEFVQVLALLLQPLDVPLESARGPDGQGRRGDRRFRPASSPCQPRSPAS